MSRIALAIPIRATSFGWRSSLRGLIASGSGRQTLKARLTMESSSTATAWSGRTLPAAAVPDSHVLLRLDRTLVHVLPPKALLSDLVLITWRLCELRRATRLVNFGLRPLSREELAARNASSERDPSSQLSGRLGTGRLGAAFGSAR